jgi:hypothetical protein
MRASVITALLMVFVMLAGCGYKLNMSPAIKSVKLGQIQNATFEPGVQDLLRTALVEELLKKGIKIDPKASHTIEGTITRYSQSDKAELNDITVQFDITLAGDFKLTSPDGQQVPLNSSGLFIVTFGGTDNLDRLMADKQMALKAAARNMAVELVASIIYR